MASCDKQVKCWDLASNQTMQVSVYVRVDDKKLSSLKIRDRWIFRETDFKKKIFICNFQQFFYKMKFFRQIDMNSEIRIDIHKHWRKS